jgi:regulator of sirC expression with transglutaminase-like and TPR domain
MNTFSQTLRQFREATMGPADSVPLARAALLIARAERASIDVEAYEQYLRRLSRALTGRLRPSADPLERIQTANQLLFEERGFHGDRDTYTDPRNLLLDEVLERRAGIPVTLALLYVDVCQGAGIPARPVGLPGHVIVRLDTTPAEDEDGEEPMFIDVFDGGRQLTRDDCRELVSSIYGQRTPFRDHFLDPVTPRQLLQRLLHNLKAGALQRGDEEQAERAIQLLLALFPWDLDELRDRGMLRERLGSYRAALEDLEMYVRFRPAARDIQTVSEAVRSLRRHINAERT